MLHGRVRNRGIIQHNGRADKLAQAHRQVFQQLCQRLPDPHRRICAIASAAEAEGRSSLAINLAATAARDTSSAVLLLDADAESPSLHKPFNLSPGPGLSEVLSGAAKLDEALRKTNIDNVTILSAGEAPLNAVALEESDKVTQLLEGLRSRFAWVFVDTAPLLTVPGTAAFCRRVDGVLLAVRWSSTRAQLVTQAVEELDSVQARPLGVVLTQRHFAIPPYVYRRL